MSSRTISGLTLLLTMAFSSLSSASAKDVKTPVVTMQLRSIENLIEDARYLAAAVGKEDEARLFDVILKSRIGAETGLEGIDVKRSLGMYAVPGTDASDLTHVFLFPIASEKAFLGLLEKLNQAPKKGDDGVYGFMLEAYRVPIHIRFAQRYAFVTTSDRAVLVTDRLLDPAKVLAAGEHSLLSIVWRLDQVPDEWKQIAITGMDLKIAAEEKEIPGESETARQLRLRMIKDLSRQVTAILQEGTELTARIDLDRKTGELSIESTVAAKPNTELARTIASMGTNSSAVAGVLEGSPAMSMLLHSTFSEETHTALARVIDEAIENAGQEDKEVGTPDSEIKKKRHAQAQQFFKALAPTLKSDELDVGFRFTGPSSGGNYTFLAGTKLKDGTGVDAAFRTLVAGLPKREQALIHFDDPESGIHQIDVQKRIGPETRKLMGESPFYLAIRPGVAWLSGGPGALKALQGALATEPALAPQIQFEVALAQLAPMLASSPDFRDKPDARRNIVRIASDVFGKAGKNSDRIVVRLEGGKTLKARVSLKAPVLPFFARLGELNKPEEKKEEKKVEKVEEKKEEKKDNGKEEKKEEKKDEGDKKEEKKEEKKDDADKKDEKKEEKKDDADKKDEKKEEKKDDADKKDNGDKKEDKKEEGDKK